MPPWTASCGFAPEARSCAPGVSVDPLSLVWRGVLSFRLLSLDLDGTLVDGRMQVSQRVRRALSAAMGAGVCVTLASGRMFGGTRLFAVDLGIHGPLICCQGALVQDADSAEVYLRHGVPLPLAHEMIDFVRAEAWDLCLYLDDLIYADRITPRIRFFAEYAPMKEEVTAIGDLKAFLSREPMKLVVVTDAEEAATVGDLLQERFAGRLLIARSFARFVEGTNLAASKGQALAFLARKLGVPRAETMAIGDNDNDADMVAWAGLGVAMGNASAAVKAVAGHIAPSIAEDGAAEAIERFVLDERHG